jgi:hypothetical protein
MKKSTKIIRSILQAIVSLIFLMAAYGKLSKSTTELSLFSAVHLGSTLVAIGVIELLIAIMVWSSKTRDLAILLATAVLGAAFAEVITFGMPTEVLAPGVVLLLVWAIFAIDHHNYQGVEHINN